MFKIKLNEVSLPVKLASPEKAQSPAKIPWNENFNTIDYKLESKKIAK